MGLQVCLPCCFPSQRAANPSCQNGQGLRAIFRSAILFYCAAIAVLRGKPDIISLRLDKAATLPASPAASVTEKPHRSRRFAWIRNDRSGILSAVPEGPPSRGLKMKRSRRAAVVAAGLAVASVAALPLFARAALAADQSLSLELFSTAKAPSAHEFSGARRCRWQLAEEPGRPARRQWPGAGNGYSPPLLPARFCRRTWRWIQAAAWMWHSASLAMTAVSALPVGGVGAVSVAGQWAAAIAASPLCRRIICGCAPDFTQAKDWDRFSLNSRGAPGPAGFHL